MKSNIPYYKEINDFLKSIPSDYLTNNPDFFCLRLKANEGSISNYKPPFRKDFYFIALVSNAGKTKITYDNTNVTKLNSFLVFQSPGLLYSFFRDNTANGYLIYFKKGCLSFFKPDFEKEFPFFNILHTNFFKLNEARFQEFAPHFEEVFSAYESATDKQHKIATIKFLALLYQLKEFTNAFKQWEEGFTTPQQIVLQKFIQLVNNFYIEKRTIEEYASLLNITPNHLSQSVKTASGKNALTFLNDRLLTEAKSLIQFTKFDIAEIAYQLNFSDPANFGKFFKKHTGQTPLEYRKSSDNK
ncbi:MAG: helix-turn-helix transcriptional regulator [Sphingobacteriales bacterium]|nr:helix-turn-helix transcriptional regulator [Sphingobacteriales bacterium]MBP9140552.1 helix-turn-helix transcriptional regulator [Chitinophagales bacterium]MDA0197268.1 AraC family transcriptional regulator [Bacteroidota bacterium]MBK6890378.1 helix-turn-helix transcriptional regulator [Sphingobacteriales bacterium]MBK7526568.1 helix-turn-helix transcriptional regulator [Sphingobacteriales bacterium]